MAESLTMVASEMRELEALDIVKRYANWSIIPGILPTPLLDTALLVGIQLRMLNQLAKHYGLPFSNDVGKSIVSSLLGSILPTQAGFGVPTLVIKSIPLVGGVLGFLFMPAFAWAATYAIGKVFIQHFESGGTFLTFDPIVTRDHFRQEFETEYAARSSGQKTAGTTTAKSSG